MADPKPVPKTYLRFRENYPEVATHYEALGKSLAELGNFDKQTAALVKLALAVARQREGGVHSATRKAADAGLDPDAMRQVALMAITTVGFSSAMAAYSWIEDVVGTKE
jgi:alkylhydroperoxidase/carboxymuconolactone decarboxylase family protein YurZ